MQRERCANNAAIRIGRRISKMIWLALKREKNGCPWETLVGYNPGKHNRSVWFVPKGVETHIKKCFKLKTFKQVEIKIKELIGK